MILGTMTYGEILDLTDEELLDWLDEQVRSAAWDRQWQFDENVITFHINSDWEDSGYSVLGSDYLKRGSLRSAIRQKIYEENAHACKAATEWYDSYRSIAEVAA